MRHTGKKIVKIVEELTMYFISIESDKIESSIQREENQYIIRFHSIFNPEYRENLKSLEKYLNTRPEAERKVNIRSVNSINVLNGDFN